MPSEALERDYQWSGAKMSAIKQIENQPIWFHNYIHDIESLWWVALWSVCYFTVASADLPPNAQKNFELLFPRHAANYLRYGLVVPYNAIINTFENYLAFNQELSEPLNDWRLAIVAFYQAHEKDYPPHSEDF